MADRSPIEWTDATWNPVTGCSVVSPGCTNCYAMRLAGTRMQHHWSRARLTQASKGGPVWTGEVRFNEEWLDQPLRWRKARRIFVAAHGDLFHEAVPDQWIDRVFAVMALAPWHTFQVLTKRAARMRNYFDVAGSNDDPDAVHQRVLNAAYDLLSDNRPDEEASRLRDLCEASGSPLPLPNVWLGVSVEDQARADERIPDLLATPAAVRFISAEPLLGPVDLTRCLPAKMTCSGCGYRTNDQRAVTCCKGYCYDQTGKSCNSWPCPQCGRHHFWCGSMASISWCIAGGESGPGARPWSIQWARELREQCSAAGVPFFWKQNGAWIPAGAVPAGEPGHYAFGDYDYDRRMRESAGEGRPRHFMTFGARSVMKRVGKKAAGRLLDGREHSELPA